MFTFLKSFFSSAAGRRRAGRHFRRSPMLEQGVDAVAASAASDSSRRANRRMLDMSRMGMDALFLLLGSGRGGLSDAQAQTARERYGANEVDHEKPLSWPAHLWLSYRNPFNL
ncbi:MAG TPA: magnesium-translocating P-type ATPase, partial [Achromobacter sp.]|nr:magnesium-translocating P-type ATPase [Achromobacter sp.]